MRTSLLDSNSVYSTFILYLYEKFTFITIGSGFASLVDFFLKIRLLLRMQGHSDLELVEPAAPNPQMPCFSSFLFASTQLHWWMQQNRKIELKWEAIWKFISNFVPSSFLWAMCETKSTFDGIWRRNYLKIHEQKPDTATRSGNFTLLSTLLCLGWLDCAS